MSAFEYKALDPKHGLSNGIIHADSAKMARALLKEKGLMPVDVVLIQEKKRVGWRRFFQGSWTVGDRALVARELAMMLGAGLPLERALHAMAEENETPRIKRVIASLRSKVMEGHPLASAMSDFPGAFPAVFQASVRAGESSGFLDDILLRLADYFETQQEVGQKFKQALVYPVLMVGLSILIVGFLMAYVVPKMVEVFEDTGTTLPLLTRILVASSEFLADWGGFLLLGMSFSLLVFLGIYRHRASFKRQVQKRWLAFPVLGSFWKVTACARFARTLGMLTGAGVPLVDGIRYAVGVLGWIPMEEAMEQAAERVRAGESVHRSLKETRYFPPLMLHLMASGEGSGQLDRMLIKAAEVEERRMGAAVGTILSVFEPCLILVMGGIVLTIVLAVLLPIFDMNQWVKV